MFTELFSNIFLLCGVSFLITVRFFFLYSSLAYLKLVQVCTVAAALFFCNGKVMKVLQGSPQWLLGRQLLLYF